MAIKDIIGPGFVGTTTIKWIPTRGLSIGSSIVPDVEGVEYWAGDDRLHYKAEGPRIHYATTDDRLHYKTREP